MAESTDRQLSRDDVFGLLSSSRRRFLLRYLHQYRGSVPIDELRAELAAWENDTSKESLTDRQLKRVYISLHQTHLPTLEDAGVIDYDREEGIVEATSKSNRVMIHLDLDDDEAPWSFAPLGIAVVGGLLFLVIISDFGIFTRLPISVAVAVIVLGGTITALIRILSDNSIGYLGLC